MKKTVLLVLLLATAAWSQIAADNAAPNAAPEAPQGTVSTTNSFAINGMAATATPGVENYVNGLNTSTSGTFGVGGTALLSATSGFSNCSLP